MSILRSLTRKHLLAHKGRTIMTIIGIALSVAMVTAVFVATASFFAYFEKVAIVSNGRQQVTYENISLEEADKLRKDERIHKVGYISRDYENSAFVLKEGKSVRKRTGSFYTADQTALEQVISCEYEGKIPENGQEIAVEEALIRRNNLNWKIGDQVTMDVGMREWINSDNKREVYFGNWRSDEILSLNGQETYTITAILHSNPGTKYLGIVRGMEDGEYTGRVDAMVDLKKVDHHSDSVIQDITREYGFTKYELNTDYLDAQFSLRKGSSFLALLPLISFVMVIIMISSILLIYNAFAMSLNEKVKYLGMLACVGATRSQKRFSIYYEGFILGLIGIPLGMISGIVGIAITLKVVGKSMANANIIPALEKNQSLVTMNVSVPWWAILAIICISGLTIFLASFVPARRASKIMPINAIRQTQDIRIKNKKYRVPFYIRPLFGYEGELAYKNMKRNGSKARIITISIATSIILFLSVNYFCDLFWASNGESFQFPFQITASASYKDREEILQKFQEIEGVDDVYYCNMIIYEYEEGKDYCPNMDIMKPEHFQSAYRKTFSEKMDLDLMLISDEDFKALCQENGIDPADYYGEETKALLLDNVTYDRNGKSVFTHEMIGQKLFYDNPDQGNEAIVEIGGFVKWQDNNHLFGMYSQNRVTALAPYEVYVRNLYGENVPEDFDVSFAIETENSTEVYEEVTGILDEGGYKNTFCQDVKEASSVMSSVLFILQIFSYGFISLITLITITNIINSITTGIINRRKEFAMLKSVGMTPKGFMKMVQLESLLYGLRALLWGLPLSLLISFLMNKILENSAPFAPNPWQYMAVTVGVLALLGITMIGSVSKIKKDSIVDVISSIY